MDIKKHLMITGNSTVSWKDAIVKAISEASKTIDYLSEVKIIEQRASIDGDKIIEYFVDLDISFSLDLNRNKKIDNYAKKLSIKTGLKIVYLSYQLHEFYKKGKMICNPKVEDFISLINNAEYVITDSFHATAFSLNLNTQFIIVYPEKFSTRLQSLLSLLNLENRVAINDSDLSVIDNKIDYQIINKKLQKMRDESLNWLKKSLEE